MCSSKRVTDPRPYARRNSVSFDTAEKEWPLDGVVSGMDHERTTLAGTDDLGQTTVEYGFVILLGLGLVSGLAAVLGFVPQRVIDAIIAALA
jgi:hypothetical protein